MKNILNSFLFYDAVHNIVYKLLSLSYQTVIRDGNWNVQANQNVAIKISIIEDTPNGTAVYEEYHNATTSVVGLVNLSVGEGNVLTHI